MKAPAHWIAWGWVLLALPLVPTGALAQWSSDPAKNLAIANRANDQVQPKVRCCPTAGVTSVGLIMPPAGTTCISSALTRRGMSSGDTTVF